MVVNKIDNTEPPYSKSRFNEAKKEVGGYLKKIGYDPRYVAYIPCSGYKGDNLIEKSNKLPWYIGDKYKVKIGKKESEDR